MSEHDTNPPNDPSAAPEGASPHLHPIIKAHLRRIGRKGGQAAAASQANAASRFNSASARAALKVRWARVRAGQNVVVEHLPEVKAL